MAFKFNPFTSTFDFAGGGTPGGSDTQVQFNDGGVFGGSAGFTFDKTTNILSGGVDGSFDFKISTRDRSDGSPMQLFLTSGSALGADASGGNLILWAGDGSGGGNGGQTKIYSGNGQDPDGTGNGGLFTIKSGDGGITSGAGGAINITAGSAQGGNSDGGSISIISGEKSGSGDDGGITLTSFGDLVIESVVPTRALLLNKEGVGLRAILDVNNIATSDKTFTFPNTTGTLGLLNQEITVYATGTAYSLTNSAAAIDFGTTDPVITLNVAGTYLIMGQVNLAYTGATVATETATIKVRRTNNTAADLSAVVVLDLPVSTVLTNTYGIFQIPPFVYTTALTDDSITLFGNVSATLGAGTIDATAIGTSLVAIRLY